MNTFIKVAQNRANHTIDELRENKLDSMNMTLTSNDEIDTLAYNISTAAYLSRCLYNNNYEIKSETMSIHCDVLITQSLSVY